MRTTLALLVILAAAAPARGQYHDGRALQKNFESADFMFRPSTLNPYGLEGFGPAAVGVMTDPLLDLSLSPSLVGRDSLGFVYLDFRGTREQQTGGGYYYPAVRYDALAAGTDMSIAPSGRWWPYWRQTYRPAEPVLSAALFTRTGWAPLSVGLTYQLIADDQPYHEVPNNLYRGLDLASFAESAGYPITDVYGGADHMRTMGHFPTLMASLEVSPMWRVGARVGFAAFDRDGEVGNTFDPDGGSGAPVSLSSPWDTRTQTYRHTDVALGVDGALASGWQVGGSLGVLMGDADQLQDGYSQYRYDYGQQSGDNFSVYRAGSLNTADLRRDGTTTYGSVFVRKQLDRGRLVTLTYRGSNSTQDLVGSVTAADSSFSRSISSYNGESYEYEYDHMNRDVRSGSGSGSDRSHRLSAGLEWELGARSRLTLGAVGTHARSLLDTDESAVSAWHHSWYNRRDTPQGEFEDGSENGLSESKDVTWEYSARTAAVRIPVVLRHDLSDHFELVAGINRTMEDIRISDETVAMVHVRRKLEDGTETVRREFGERFREPTQYRTNIETGLLLGLTARPSPNLDIRLLVSPRWSTWYETRRTQFWLGLQLRP